MPRDREPETQAAVAPRGHRGTLTEPLEEFGQELGKDAHAGVGDGDFGVVRALQTVTLTVPPLGVNLIAFETRFQTIC